MENLVDLEEGEIIDENQQSTAQNDSFDSSKDIDERQLIVYPTNPVDDSNVASLEDTTGADIENDFETIYTRGASPPPPLPTELSSPEPPPHHQNHSRRILKPEICKFYYIGKCYKSRMCQYMHSEFPCKFYYLGLDCPGNDKCLFLHGKPLKKCMKTVLINHLKYAPQQFLADLPIICRLKAINLLNTRDKELKLQFGADEIACDSDIDTYITPIKKRKTRWSPKVDTAGFGECDMRMVPKNLELVSFGKSDVDMRVLPDTTTSDCENIDGDKLISQPLASIHYIKKFGEIISGVDAESDWDDDDNDGLEIILDESVKLPVPEEIKFSQLPVLQDLVPATVIDGSYNSCRPIEFKIIDIEIPKKDYSNIKRHLLSPKDPRLALFGGEKTPLQSIELLSPVRLNYPAAQIPLEVFKSQWYCDLSTSHKILVNHFICNLNKSRDYDTQNIIPELQKLLATPKLIRN